jgi:hypothetical protein
MDTQIQLIQYHKASGEMKLSDFCYSIPFLKRIVTKWPDPEEHMKIFQYLYFTTADSISNPYMNYSIYEREFKVLKDLECDFDIEDPLIVYAKERLTEMYELPSSKAYKVISELFNKIASNLIGVSPMGLDAAKIKSIQETAGKFKENKKLFDETRRDMVIEEGENKRAARNRGNISDAYDD